ncbi:MAG: hypothetical protein C0179_00710 [Fervidicoccus sp.]|nr:MAG: hypothetical protein C0179_00710 [Fervidicoccus sp.]
MNSDYILEVLINYGLAGIVVYIFYKLISNDLRDVRESIDKLRNTIEELIKAIYRSNTRG